MSDDPDSADVRRVLAGDVEAFGGIVRRAEPRLYALALRLCRDRGRAEDMTQEAFVRVFRSLPQWRGESSFATWTTSVALNAYRSYLRARRSTTRPLDAEADALAATPEEASEGERAALVRRVVAALPAPYRDALTLFYFCGQDLEETASTLRIPIGTLKARLHRGRKLVRDALQGRASGEGRA